jgi:FixJ family two-component response regulator
MWAFAPWPVAQPAPQGAHAASKGGRFKLTVVRRIGAGQYGYDTELYASGKAFRKAAAQIKAVCLIVDVELGDSCGIDLVRDLAETGFNFPIIYVTGSDDQTLKRRAEELGCVAFLRKPFPAAVLIEALTKAME